MCFLPRRRESVQKLRHSRHQDISRRHTADGRREANGRENEMGDGTVQLIAVTVILVNCLLF